MKFKSIKVEDIQPNDSISRIFLRGVELVTMNEKVAEVIRENFFVWFLMTKCILNLHLNTILALDLASEEGVMAYNQGLEYGAQLVLAPPGCADIGL